MFRKSSKAITVALILIICCAFAHAKHKPKMIVQLQAQSIGAGGLITDVYLILEDGSYAKATCLMGIGRPCQLDPFRPEKRSIVNCLPPDNSFQAMCFQRESYYADRKVNDITIYAANGPVSFHIVGPWQPFHAGELPRSSH